MGNSSSSKQTLSKPTLSKPTLSKPTLSKPTPSKPTPSKPTPSKQTYYSPKDINYTVDKFNKVGNLDQFIIELNRMKKTLGAEKPYKDLIVILGKISTDDYELKSGNSDVIVISNAMKNAWVKANLNITDMLEIYRNFRFKKLKRKSKCKSKCKSKRKSRKAKRKSRKSKRKSRKAKRKSKRKSRRKSRKSKRKSKRKSRKAKRKSRKAKSYRRPKGRPKRKDKVTQKQGKYMNRPSPPYKANKYCGKVMEGNDGNMYRSVKNKKGICQWKLVKN